MKTVLMSLTLGLLAVGGLIAGGAFMTSAYAVPTDPDSDPVNVATAANSDDDNVTQSNTASVSQHSEIKCKASVDDDDVVQVGRNVNTAANDCDNTQTATVGQANINEDNDVQTAIATACQSNALLLSLNICGNVEEEE